MNKTTNTSGAITAATQQKPVENKPRTPSQLLNSLLNNNAIQETLKSTLKENSGAFAASVMNLFNNDKLLQLCEPKAVLSEALKAAALKLPLEKQLGFAYIVPYKAKIKDENGNYIQVDLPQFQLGYKGYIQLAIRSGKYKHINSGIVYDGELKSVDKLTGTVDLSGERISDEVIGYFAYIETLEGYSQTSFWSKKEVENHAKRYSKAYKNTNTPWHTEFDKMAMKTVLKDLISHYGPMSIEMSRAFTDEATPPESAEMPVDGGEIVVDDTTPVNEEPPAVEPESASNNEEYPFPNE